MWRTRGIARLALLCILAFVSSTAEGQLFASEPNGSQNLLTIDQSTGLATIVGPMTGAAGPVTEIEWSPDGQTLYATTGGGTSAIHTLDPETGAVLSTVFHPFGALNGLEFDATGNLLGTFIPIGGGSSSLVRVNPSTGVLTTIGLTGTGPIGGLAFDPSFNALYGIDSGQTFPIGLHTISPTTGGNTSTVVTTLPVEASSLEFDSNGRLVAGGADDILYSINPTNGLATPIGAMNTSGGKISGLSSVSPVIPPGLIDLSISLYGKPLDPAYPRGDDNGNTQNPFVSSEQDKYELLLQHFADAVYEATNAQLTIRRISIFSKGGRPQDTDIVWREAGHPNTSVVAGLGIDGAPLNMYDVFTGGAGDADIALLEVAGRQKGGYVLAQRWMHYFLSIEHEFAEAPGDVPVVGTLMADPYKASDNADPAFLNLSVAPNRTDPFSGNLRIFDTSRDNAQLRLFRLSAWETISQIYSDPKTANELAVAARTYHPGLAAVAPAGLDFPRIDLPSLPGDATNSRSDLDIIWDNGQVPMVTIDQIMTTLDTQVQQFDFPIDESVSRLEVTAVFETLPQGATVLLVDPLDNILFPLSSTTIPGGNTLQVFVVNDPPPGPWSLLANSRLGEIEFAFSATALLENSPITLSVNSIHGESLQYPTPLVIQANLGLGLGIRNANVSGTIQTPSGQIQPLEFRDDGIPPDAISADGSYAAATDYFFDGRYVVVVTADNANQRARITYNGTRRSPADGGAEGAQALAQLPDVPLREPFLRKTTLEVQVSGVVTDDHGDFFQDATVATTDNVSVFGRFERSLDRDFFTFTVPAGMTSITTRVTDIGDKSNARLTVFDVDGSTVLEQGRNGRAGYLIAVADVVPGSTYFALVEEASANLSGGRYAFSVGSEIASDNAPPRFAIGGGGGGGCLIATAAYGTPLAEQIDVLRVLRDERMLRGAFGTAFVDTYYRLSPAAADAVASNEALRTTVRLLLLPILIGADIILVTPLWAVMFLMLSAFALRHVRRRKAIRRRS